MVGLSGNNTAGSINGSGVLVGVSVYASGVLSDRCVGGVGESEAFRWFRGAPVRVPWDEVALAVGHPRGLLSGERLVQCGLLADQADAGAYPAGWGVSWLATVAWPVSARCWVVGTRTAVVLPVPLG